jgi:hypothetical protein
VHLARNPAAAGAVRHRDLRLGRRLTKAVESGCGQMRGDRARRSCEAGGQRPLLPGALRRGRPEQPPAHHLPAAGGDPVLDLAGTEATTTCFRARNEPVVARGEPVDAGIWVHFHARHYYQPL